MIIEKHKDYETEGILQSIDEQLQSCKNFQERQQIFYQLIRQSKQAGGHTKMFSNFLLYAILREL